MRVIRTAQPHEASLLSELAFKSKAYWGYSEDFMASCKQDLEVTASDLALGLTGVLEDKNTIVGFYSLAGNKPEGILTDLFVEPKYIGTGAGKVLWNAAVEQARNIGFSLFLIHADPHAESFYVHMGAKRISTVPSSSIAGRNLPLLLFLINC